MFTLRVEWKRAGEVEYSMHECSEYSVQKQAADGRTVVAMDQGTPEPRDLLLEAGQVVYVMNASGKTVDTIGKKKRRA